MKKLKKKKRPLVRSSKLTETTKLLLQAALKEDVGPGDVSSLVVPAAARSEAKIIAREDGYFCGSPALREIFREADPGLKVSFPIAEGGVIKKGKTVVRLKGKTRSILKSERTALNILGMLSGVTTLTRQYVDAVKKYPVLILDTRKTTPLWRELEKYAVIMGGGRNHRMGLYDEVFIKENHRAHGQLNKLKSLAGRFEIEVRNMKELKDAVPLGPRVILFDNFTPERLGRAVRWAREKSPHTILEASGGMTLENVAHYAAMGVDWISVGAITHSSRCLDFSLIME